MQDWWSTFIPYTIGVLIVIVIIWALIRKVKKDSPSEKNKDGQNSGD